MKNFKVIVFAYACEPGKGSEPGVGWHWVRQIARSNEVWVITRKNNRGPIEQALEKDPSPNLRFFYTDLPEWARFWKKGGRGVRLYYYLWQFVALFNAVRLNREINFDLSHHITFVNDWQPSLLSLLPVPFIWGPIGSNARVPEAFLGSRKLKMRYMLQAVIKALFRLMDPFFYLTVFRAKKIILINDMVTRIFPYRLLPMERFVLEPAIGIDNLQPEQCKASTNSRMRVISVGQLIYIKGFELAISAFAAAAGQNDNMELVIIGDGQERNKMGRLAESSGAGERISFLGNVGRSSVLDQMACADVFLFPSFEGGGMVVLEAMASGLPVVCLEFGGPGEMVTEACGIKIAPTNVPQTVKGLSDSLLLLAADPGTRIKMGEAGKKRVREVFGWEKKGELVDKIYAEVVTQA